MNASMEAGLAFSNASLGLVHAMSHVLGGYKDFPHGVCNGVLLKAVCRYNYSSCPDRYDRITETLALSRAASVRPGPDALMDELDLLIQGTGINDSLDTLRLTEDECLLLARLSLQDICNATNPRIPLLEEVNELYKEVFG
jgi:alcohol dehydrogenase class IV